MITTISGFPTLLTTPALSQGGAAARRTEPYIPAAPLSHGAPGEAASNPRIPTGPRPTFAATPLERLQAQRGSVEVPERPLPSRPATEAGTETAAAAGEARIPGDDVATPAAPGLDAVQDTPAKVPLRDVDLRR